MSATKTRIMYIENKSEGLNGSARIGRVTFSKTGRTIRYRGKSFQSLKGYGFKANYFDIDTGERYWISGPHKDGTDRLYGGSMPVEIDDDVVEEYWTEIRKRQPPKVKTQSNEPYHGDMAADPDKDLPKWGRKGRKIAETVERRSQEPRKS